MNVDRFMVNLFFEIRRNLPSQQQQGMRLSAPDLGDKMIILHKASDNEDIQLLIEMFLERAGEDWIKKIRKKKSRKQRTNATKEKLKPKEKATKKSNYYRGVKISWAGLAGRRCVEVLCRRVYGKTKKRNRQKGLVFRSHLVNPKTVLRCNAI